MSATRLTFAGALLTLAITGLASAEPVPMKFNFGGDISGTAGYEDYIHADNDYSAGTGHGWTFTHDSGAAQQPAMLFRDRSGSGESPTAASTVALDLRGEEGEQADSDPAVLRDAFTFRVDLPNGEYHLQVQIGDQSGKRVTTVWVGDTFHSEGNTGALDESAANSSKVVAGQFTSSETLTLPADEPHTFDVTQGYILIGFRRDESAIRWAGLNNVTITPVPEPASFGLLGAGALMLGWRDRTTQ